MHLTHVHISEFNKLRTVNNSISIPAMKVITISTIRSHTEIELCHFHGVEGKQHRNS